MKIFSFDAEPEGLYGQPFAIGAVVLEEGKDLITFGGWVEPDNNDDDWVKARLPAVLRDNLTRFSSRDDLKNEFWKFWLKSKDDAICVVDWGHPVESGLMRNCVEIDKLSRQFLGPAPLHEVSTALLCAGIDPDIDRINFSGIQGLIKHNPIHDALASATCFRIALKKLGI